MRSALFVALSLCLFIPATAQDKKTQDKPKELKVPDGWIKGESKHYIILTEDDKLLLKQYQVYMELLFKQYAKAFKFKGKLKTKAVVFIHKDRNSYVGGGAPRSSVAYYSHEKKKLVSYKDKELLQFLAHEATHQFFDLAFPDFFNNKDVPMWFSEGIAECFCNCQIERGRLVINDLRVANAYRNVMSIQDDLKTVKYTKIRDMLDMSKNEFMQNAGRLYPQSWSFCHFLWNFPKVNGKGKYFNVLLKLIEAFKEGKTAKEAYKEAFGKLSIKKLEAEWKAYVKAMKAKRPSGSDER